MLEIGLTGGIGTGKTEVSRMLEDLGAEVINADLLGTKRISPRPRRGDASSILSVKAS